MRQLLHVPCNKKEHRTIHVTEHSLWAHGCEMQGRLHQRPSAPVSQENSLGRMSVPVRIVLSAGREHEVGICSSHNYSQRNDVPRQSNSTPTVLT